MTIRGMQRVRQAGYLKDLRVFLVRDFENLWYSWNVNHFCIDQDSRPINCFSFAIRWYMESP